MFSNSIDWILKRNWANSNQVKWILLSFSRVSNNPNSGKINVKFPRMFKSAPMKKFQSQNRWNVYKVLELNKSKHAFWVLNGFQNSEPKMAVKKNSPIVQLSWSNRRSPGHQTRLSRQEFSTGSSSFPPLASVRLMSSKFSNKSQLGRDLAQFAKLKFKTINRWVVKVDKTTANNSLAISSEGFHGTGLFRALGASFLTSLSLSGVQSKARTHTWAPARTLQLCLSPAARARARSRNRCC